MNDTGNSIPGPSELILQIGVAYDKLRAQNIIEQLKEMCPESRDMVVQYVLSEYLSR